MNYLGETDYLLPGVAFILEVVVLAALIVGLVLFPWSRLPGVSSGSGCCSSSS